MNKTTMMGQLNWIHRINLMYGAIGLVAICQFGTGGSWRSFLAGWAVAVVNLELLRRIGTLMVALYNGEKLSPFVYVFLFAKFAFWGLIIALFSTAKWIQAIPFVLGTTTLIVAGLGLAMKELVYARAS